MKKAFLFLSFLAYTFAFAQYTASDEEVYIVSANYAQSYMNIQNPDISFLNFPSQSKPFYEISLGNGQTLIVSSQKIATPILAIIKNPTQIPILGNSNLPDGLQYMIDKFSDQILHAMDGREHSIHPLWDDLLSDVQGGTLKNRNAYGPYLTTAWGQDRPNDTPWEAAFNYYVGTTDDSCQGGDMGHKCPTGCVATAMAQIMKYWNYPVFRHGLEFQYDWCNMPDSLRTIPSGAISEYVAHKEVVLRPGFTALNGSNFTAHIEPCAECEEERGKNLPSVGERDLSDGHAQDGRTRCVPTDNGLVIYPNPAGGTLTVDSASPIRQITVYDLSGRVMMTANGGIVETCHGASLQMDVSSLQGGIYLLRVVTENGVETGRFVKN